jgi:uncharacterized membrane protein YeaQ/YmgE (transglycosylase-associated protein family)
MSFLISLAIGGVAGTIAGWIRKGKSYGFFGNIAIGLLGGFVGNTIFSLLGIQDTNWFGTLLFSVIGSLILLTIFNAITHKDL